MFILSDDRPEVISNLTSKIDPKFEHSRFHSLPGISEKPGQKAGPKKQRLCLESFTLPQVENERKRVRMEVSLICIPTMAPPVGNEDESSGDKASPCINTRANF